MIKIKNVDKEYTIKNSERNCVIQNMNLEFKNYGLVFIIGKSGSGKTTLLNLIGGLDIFDKGSIYINNVNTKEFTSRDYNIYRRDQVGFVFQEHNLLSTYTIRKNLTIALELQGKTVCEDEIDSVMNKMDLDGFKDRYPEELSTGQKQRVAIARAIIKKPKLILADEPTGSLDSDTGKKIMELLKNLSKDRLVIVVTHDSESAYEYGDRVVEIADGQITKDTILNTILPVKSNNMESSGINEVRERSRNRMKTKDIISLSLKNLLSKKYRLIFTLLLCTIAFTLFGVSDTIASYDADDALLQSLNEVDRKYVTISKDFSYIDEITGDGIGERPSFTDEDILELNSIYPNGNYYKVFFNYNDYFGTEVNKLKLLEYESQSGKLYTFEINGATEISNEFLEDTGIELIAGSLPDRNTEDNEIVITKYLYETFKNFDIEQGEENIEITDLDAIIGKTINGFKIVGVVDTSFDFNRYSVLDEDPNIDSDSLRNISFELQSILDTGLHTLIYFRDGYYDEVIDNQSVFTIGTLNLSTKIGSEYISLGQANSVMKFSDLTREVYTVSGVQVNELNYNEIIIPIDMLPKFGEPGFGILNTYSNLIGLIEDEMDSLVSNFALINYSLIVDDFESDFGASAHEDYKEYILSNESNIYQSDYNLSHFTNLARETIVINSIFDEMSGTELVYFDNFGFLTENLNLKVVGVYFPENPIGDVIDRPEVDNPIVMSNDLIEYVNNDIGLIIVTLSGNNSKDINIILAGNKETDDNFYGIDYILNSEYKKMIEYAGGYISFISLILVSVGGLFAVFASLLLFNFISTSIRLKQKDIGILRSIGASSSDVFRIFSIESLMVGLVCFILSLTITIPVISIFDNILQKQFFVPVSFVFVTMRQVLLLFLISTGVALLATVVPIYNFSRKRPIDMIKKVSL